MDGEWSCSFDCLGVALYSIRGHRQSTPQLMSMRKMRNDLMIEQLVPRNNILEGKLTILRLICDGPQPSQLLLPQLQQKHKPCQ